MKGEPFTTAMAVVVATVVNARSLRAYPGGPTTGDPFHGRRTFGRIDDE